MEFYSDEKIGKIIKQHRVFMNMTQADLGEKLGVQAAAVQKWESGRVKNIKRSTIRDLSRILKIHPAVLIGFPVEEEQYKEIHETGVTVEEQKLIDDFIKKLVELRRK